LSSPNWTNGTAAGAGAATWGSGAGGISGPVTVANSLVGSTTNDNVGSGGVTVLTNGNYVVDTPFWANGVGAVTFGSGTAGVSGAVSAVNSLVGSSTDDFVGYGGVTALTNGNYVVSSPNWTNDTPAQLGAVTWGSGTAGISGPVSSTNSLVGSSDGDKVGSGQPLGGQFGPGAAGVTALTNGNYVVDSPHWSSSTAALAGAVTFGNGAGGISGPVSAANSLVGSSGGDVVGSNGVTALTNGSYVVSSWQWTNSGAGLNGAATWGSGTAGISGPVSAANSLVGGVANFRRFLFSIVVDNVNGTFYALFLRDGGGHVRVGSQGTLSIQGDVYILNQSASGALSISGNVVLNVANTLQVDSSSATAVTLSGNAQVDAAQTFIVGGDKVSGNARFADAPTIHDSGASLADPLSSLAAPTGGTSYAAVKLSSGTIMIGPGAYPSITVSGTAHLIMTPGVYIIGTGGVTISGNASVTNTTDAEGDGVLIYNNGGLNVSGSASVNLTASSTGMYADVAIFQARTDTSAVTVSGSAELNLNAAALYAANVQSVVTVSGSAQVAAALVVNELTLSGNSDDTADD
jgi:hypothetical protein